jgi:hypothetical protein
MQCHIHLLILGCARPHGYENVIDVLEINKEYSIVVKYVHDEDGSSMELVKSSSARVDWIV